MLIWAGFQRFTTLGVVILFAACATGGAGRGGITHDEAAAADNNTPTPAPIAVALRLTEKSRDLHATLSARDDASWVRDNDEEGAWLTSPGWRATDAQRFDRFAARIPQRADQALEASQGRFDRFRIRLTPEGANASEVQMHRGRAFYSQVFPATDVVVGSTPDSLEELLILNDASAPHTFHWKLSQPRGLPNVHVETSGAIVFADAKDEGVLRIPAAFAFDAKGEKRQAQLTYSESDHRLSVDLDTKGLTYPIALDPALEAFIWEDRNLGTNPGVRCQTAPVFDSVRNVVVLFGGSDCASTNLADTWEYDGTTWTPRCGAGGTPACGVPTMPNPAGAFHPARGKSLYVGMNGFVGETIEWNGTSWSIIPAPTSSTSTPPNDNQTVPGIRQYTGLAFDAARNEIVLHGGAVFGGFNDTWTWSAAGTWTRKTVSAPIDCSVNPPCRYFHGMAYDATRQRIPVFGGGGSGGGGPQPGNAMWEWNGTAWNFVATTNPPTNRSGTGMAYDARRKVIVMFGGGNLDDTWEWDGVLWRQRSPLTHPPGAYANGLAFDSLRGRVVLSQGVKTWEYRTHGGGCVLGSECDTGSCVDGVCCESPSCGTCQVCNGVNPGVCTTVTSTTDDTCVGPAKMCDPTGVCRAAQGQSCVINADCLANHCVDNFCCDTPCDATCQACSAAAKTSGIDNGTCGAAANGQDPHNNCAALATTTCATDGFCNGSGACRLFAAGTACGAGAVCDPVTNAAKGQLCNGAGTCLAETDAGTPCGQFDCTPGAGCGSTCATHADCIPSAYCDANVCKAKTSDGIACKNGDSCVSGVCADGLCCNRPCNGQCEACDVASAEGKCVPVVGAPHTNHAACSAPSASDVCSESLCDGNEATSCKGFVGSAKSCRQPSCANGTQTLPAACDGKGSCPAAVTKKCDPFVCDATTNACKLTCVADADCVQGTCDLASKKCVSGATCNEHTVTDPAGNTIDCAPYNCEGNGTCKTTCASVGDCASPSVCDESHHCVAPSPPTDNESGCAAASSTGSSNDVPPIAPASMLVVAIASALLRRRRLS